MAQGNQVKKDPWILITLISVCAPSLTLKTLKENVD